MTIRVNLLLIGAIFIALKLFGVIGWSWWIVLLPFWLFPAIWIGGLIFAACLALIAAAFKVL